MTTTGLALPAELHKRIAAHLFPGDGLEAAAILLCSRTPAPRIRLLAREAILVPHEACRRQEDYLTWPGLVIEDAIDRAETDDLSLVLIHSHPGGLFQFSRADDASDAKVVPGIFQALGPLHGTAIMVPNGAVMARLYDPAMVAMAIELVTVPGPDFKRWWSDEAFHPAPMAFTSEMRKELGRLCVCVIGVSGTGSVIAEQCARMGFGSIVLIDFDKVEDRNLNRILNSTIEDIGKFKVEIFANAVDRICGPGVAVPVATTVSSRSAVLQASQADVLFSCVDTLEARQIADLIASSFLIPLIDMGVVIPTRRAGDAVAIGDVCGRLDFVFPGGSTLADRDVYDPARLRAEYLRNSDPEAHAEELRNGYIRGATEQAPSVIALNMRAASAAALELIARMYPFRHNPNEDFARTEFSLAAAEEEHFSESMFTRNTNSVLGRGHVEPLLGIPSLKLPRKRS